MYDVIVVGARCAGASLAMLLARQGARVLMVDRATFPSDIPHGHFIHRHGPPRLQRWGLLDAIAAASPPITAAVTDFGDFPLVSRGLEIDGVAWGYAPRRVTLDKILFDAAVAAGVEARMGINVDEYLTDDGAIAGIRGRSAGGQAVEERATITVGADGRNSRLAHTVQAPTYKEEPKLTGYYFSYWQDVEAEPFEMYVRNAQRRAILSFRTDNEAFAVFVTFPIEELPQIRTDVEGEYRRVLELAPHFAARVLAGHRNERFYGATDLPNFYRKPHGPGWALVGDAGAHKDPFMALGISDALRDAELLATAISDGLAGKRSMDEALAGYESERNAASDADYQQNLAAARFTPTPPEVLGLRAAVRNNPDASRDMMLANFGRIDPPQFFSPENIQRLMQGASGTGGS